MNGPVHELVLIALAARAGLAGDEAAMTQLWPRHPAFQHTQWVQFAEPGGMDDQERVLAADPPAWLALLKADGTTRVGIGYAVQTGARMDRMTSGFVGGGRRWTLYTSDGERSAAWLPRLALDQEERERMIRMRSLQAKIWRSSYLRREETRLPALEDDLEGAARALETALEEIAAFAVAHEVRAWVETAFTPALDVLTGRRGVDLDHSRLDFKPFCRSAFAARLLNAAMPAWVFGGMGSWNDQRFEDDDEYERVSGQLFEAIHRAVAAGVNGDAPRATGAAA